MKTQKPLNKTKKITKRKAQVKKIKTNSDQKQNFKFELDNKTLLSALKNLRTLDERQKGNTKDLLSMNETSLVYLNFLVNELPEEVNIKPVRISLTSGLYNESKKKFCFIVSDQFKLKFKNELKNSEFSNWKFLSFDKLKRNYKTFDQKRKFFEEFELFFCEGRIFMLMKKMLGRTFYQRKKYPFPVELSSVVECQNRETPKYDLSHKEGEIDHILDYSDYTLNTNNLKELLTALSNNSSYFYQGNGPEYSVKIGRLSESTKNVTLIKNIKSGLKQVMQYMLAKKLKLKNIRRISLKLAQSVSLPVYSYLSPEEIAQMKLVLTQE